MRTQSVLRLAASILLYSSIALSQAPPTNVLTADTDAFINKILADWNSPGGIAVAIVRKNEAGKWNVETKGYGVATLDGRKVDSNTRFAIASNSKLFTAIATGLLIKNESLSPRLSWTSKMSSVIPNWSLSDPIASRQSTILDLMSHRTGLPRHDSMYKLTDNAMDIIPRMKYLSLSLELRDGWQYSNIMYGLLSTLPQVLLPSKIRFTRYVKQHIFDPLGMNATTYSFKVANSTGDLANGLTRQGVNFTEDLFGNGTVRTLPFWLAAGGEDGNVLSGAGGIISNAIDMATWLKTLLLNGANPATGQVVIPADVIEKAATGISVWTGQASYPELSPVVYGGGQGRKSYRGHELIEHGGDVPGYHSQVSRLPNDNLGVAVLTNDNIFGYLIVETVKYHIIDSALGLEPVDWKTRYKALASQYFGSPPATTPRPSNATLPSKTIASLVGNYKNGGYGSLELCFVSNMNTTTSSVFPVSAACKALVSQSPIVLPGAIDPSVPTFLAKWESPWASHLKFSHFSANTFNVSLLTSMATGDANEPYWTSDGTDSSGTLAEFASGGFALTGIWGAGAGVASPQGQSAHDRAEVWFDQI